MPDQANTFTGSDQEHLTLQVAAPKISIPQRYVLFGTTLARVFWLKPDGARFEEILAAINRQWPGAGHWDSGRYYLAGSMYGDKRIRALISGMVRAGLLDKRLELWFDGEGRERPEKPHYTVTESGAAALGGSVRRMVNDLLYLDPKWHDYGGQEEFERRHPKRQPAPVEGDGPEVGPVVLSPYEQRLLRQKEERRRVRIAELVSGLPPEAGARVAAELLAAPLPPVKHVGKRRGLGRGELCALLAVARAQADKRGQPAHSAEVRRAYRQIDGYVSDGYMHRSLDSLSMADYLILARRGWQDARGNYREQRQHWSVAPKGKRTLDWAEEQLRQLNNGAVLPVRPLRLNLPD